MPLNDVQIQELFAFTKRKYVHYYDLQVELVDHLAASIEEEMEQHPAMSFEHSLQKVYAGFGIFGFAKVVQEKEAALRRSNNRIWLEAVKQFFTIPKIFMTTAVFFAALFFGEYLSPEWRAIAILALWFTFLVVEIINNIRIKKAVNKKLLLTQYIHAFNFSTFMIPYWMIVSQHQVSHALLFAVWILVVFVVEMAVVEVNQRVRKKAIDLYPEAFVVAS